MSEVTVTQKFGDVAGAGITALKAAGVNIATSSITTLAVIADADAKVAAAPGLRLVGFACKESAATAAVATFNIVRGATAAGGTILVPVKLAASESTREWFGPEGIDAATGISIDWVAGTIDIVLFFKVVI